MWRKSKNAEAKNTIKSTANQRALYQRHLLMPVQHAQSAADMGQQWAEQAMPDILQELKLMVSTRI